MDLGDRRSPVLGTGLYHEILELRNIWQVSISKIPMLGSIRGNESNVKK